MNHYSKIELDRYLHNNMNMLARLSCTKHIKQCDNCNQLLNEIKADEQMLKDIRNGVNLINTVPPENKTTDN
jgi:hypothetical protein